MILVFSGLPRACTDKDGDGEPESSDCDDSDARRFHGNPRPRNCCQCRDRKECATNHDKLAELVKKYVNVSIIPADSRDKTVDLMIKNYTGYLGYTVDPAAIDAWNEYLQANKLTTRPVKPEEVIYSGAPKP